MKKFILILSIFLYSSLSVYSINTDYCGIGAQVVKDKKKVFIIDILPNSPAQKAGLFEGAEIIQINGCKVKNLTANEVISMLNGENNTNVNLLIKNNRKKSEYTITRKAFPIQNSETDKNFSVHWQQVVPAQYENAKYIPMYKQYSNNLLWQIEKNNYWVERKELFRTGYNACLTYPAKDKNACFMNLVNREIDRTLKEKELQNQQEMIRQQMYQNYQLQHMYYRNPYYWY